MTKQLLKLRKTQFFLAMMTVCAMLLGNDLVSAGPHADPFGQNACAEFVINSDFGDTDAILGTTFSVGAGFQSLALEDAGIGFVPTVKPPAMAAIIINTDNPFGTNHSGWSFEQNAPLASQGTLMAFDWDIQYTDDYNTGTPVPANLSNWFMGTSTCADWGGNTFGGTFDDTGGGQYHGGILDDAAEDPALGHVGGHALMTIPPDGCFGILWSHADFAQHWGVQIYSLSISGRQVSTEEYPCR